MRRSGVVQLRLRYKRFVRVLVVEDEALLSRQLASALSEAGYAVDCAADGERADFLGLTEQYDAVILDLGLPKTDGLTVLRRWREAGLAVPVLVLTARGSWHEKVQGIDGGADDYVAKPFRIEEVLARLRALIRRASGQVTPELRCGGLVLDPRVAKVTVADVAVKLTSHEFRVLSYLMHQRGRVVSQTELTEHIYAQSADRDSNTVEVFIARLRRKLGRSYHRDGPRARVPRRGGAMTVGGSFRRRLIVGSLVWIFGFLAMTTVVGMALIHRYPHLVGFVHNSALIVFATVCLVGGLSMIRHGLSPFTELRERLAAVRDGRDRRVDGRYPSEVQPLVDDLNALLEHREQTVRRAIAKAGDLAHALKTPLAVLAHEAEAADAAGYGELAAIMSQQVERMRRQMDYHLAHARAAASGATPGARC